MLPIEVGLKMEPDICTLQQKSNKDLHLLITMSFLPWKSKVFTCRLPTQRLPDISFTMGFSVQHKEAKLKFDSLSKIVYLKFSLKFLVFLQMTFEKSHHFYVPGVERVNAFSSEQGIQTAFLFSFRNNHHF